MDRQTIKDLAYSRQHCIAAYAHWPFIVLSMWWLFIVGGWMVHGVEVTRFRHIVADMAIFPFLYMLFCVLNYHYIWRDRGHRLYRYSMWITDPVYDTAIPWLERQGLRKGRHFTLGRGDWNADETGNKWRYELLFERADHWMLAKMRY